MSSMLVERTAFSDPPKRAKITKQQTNEPDDLDTVTVPEINADMGRYKGRLLHRKLISCQEFSSDDGAYSRCSPEDGSGDFQVYYSGALRKHLAKIAGKQGEQFDFSGTFKVIGHGTDAVSVRLVSIDEGQ